MTLPILAKGRISEKPYLFKSEEIRVYSLEEICYCLVNFPTMPPDDIFCEELCRYVEEDLELSDLAEGLRLSLGRPSHPQSAFTHMLLTYAGYPEPDRIKALQGTIAALEDLSHTERMKKYADGIARSGRLYSALDLYIDILKETGDDDIVLRSAIYHNCGVIYARMFLFDSAAGEFKKAYVTSKDQRSLDAYKAAVYYSDTDRERLISDRLITPEDVEEVALCEKRILEKAAEAENDGEKPDEDFHARGKRIVSELKTDYLKRMENGIITADFWSDKKE